MHARFTAGPAWRIGPGGTLEIYLVRIDAERSAAIVCSRGQRGRWAKVPMTIDARDVFATRDQARAEYRRRKAAGEPLCF